MSDDTRRAPTPDEVARFFHETYERLAPRFAYTTRKASAVPWEQVPENNRRLMTAVVAEVVERFLTDTRQHTPQDGRGVIPGSDAVSGENPGSAGEQAGPMQVRRWKRRPIDVDAVQFDGTNGGEICAWMRSNRQMKVYESRDFAGQHITIDRRDGSVLRADVGYYVVREPHPEGDHIFAAVPEHIFEHGHDAYRFVPPKDMTECDLCKRPRSEHTVQGFSDGSDIDVGWHRFRSEDDT